MARTEAIKICDDEACTGRFVELGCRRFVFPPLLLPFDGLWCLLFCAAIDSTDVAVAAAALILGIDALSAAADILCAAFTEDNGVYMADSGEL